MYEVEGYVKKVGETEQVSEKFSKRLIVVSVDKDYNGKKFTDDYPIEFTQEKTALLDTVGEGEQVTVKWVVRGREWQGKWFTNLGGISIRTNGINQERPVAPQQAQTPPPPPVEYEDDLPF
jgi:hypothetical protein